MGGGPRSRPPRPRLRARGGTIRFCMVVGPHLFHHHLRGVHGVPRTEPHPYRCWAYLGGDHRLYGELSPYLLWPHLPAPRGAFRIGRAYSTYALTDESYAIVSARPNAQRIDGSRVLAIQVFCHVMWVSSGVLGAVAGSAIPQGLKGMEFALTALFIVLAWESFRNNQDWSLIFFAVAFSLIGLGLVPQQMLIFALVVYFLLLLVRNASPRIDARLTWKIGDRR